MILVKLLIDLMPFNIPTESIITNDDNLWNEKRLWGCEENTKFYQLLKSVSIEDTLH